MNGSRNKGIKSQAGMGLMIIFAAVAALALLAVMGSGLISTLISGNQRSVLSIETGQILTQAAYTIITEANTAGSYPVAVAPTAWSGVNPAAAPAIGTANAVGLVSAGSAAPKVDAWGSSIGYCTFTAVAAGNPVFAVISAGPDKIFQTTCTQAFAGVVVGDDGVRFKTAINVVQGVGGTVYYGDPVASYAALPTTGNKVGAVRFTTDLNRGYMWNGAAWVALAVDQNGSIAIPGTATMANAVITGAATSGAACSPNGKLAQDGTGLLLNCQSLIWVKAASSGWKTLPLTDTNPFNPQCDYIMSGMRVGYIDASAILVINNTVSGATTAIWYVVGYTNKKIYYMAQDNYSNNMYYGGYAVSSIQYRC